MKKARERERDGARQEKAREGDRAMERGRENA